MLLAGLTEEPGWIRSSFNLTYRVSWETLLKGVRGVYPYMRGVSPNDDTPEVLVDNAIVQISSPDEILAIPEAGSITIRGFAPVIKAPAMLVFHNQVPSVNVAVGRVGEEYQNTDYEKFNKSMCQFMDSIEIMMHLPVSEQ
jgi:hypothetical protein